MRGFVAERKKEEEPDTYDAWEERTAEFALLENRILIAWMFRRFLPITQKKNTVNNYRYKYTNIFQSYPRRIYIFLNYIIKIMII